TDQFINVAEGGAIEAQLLAAQQQRRSLGRVRENALGFAQDAGAAARLQQGRIDDASFLAEQGRRKGDRFSSAAEIPADAAARQIEALNEQPRQLDRARDAETKIADIAEQEAALRADLTRLQEQELRMKGDVMRAEARKTREAIKGA